MYIQKILSVSVSTEFEQIEKIEIKLNQSYLIKSMMPLLALVTGAFHEIMEIRMTWMLGTAK